MKIIRAKNYIDMSRKAANIVSAQVILKPNCVLGLATGSTPVGMYEQLIDWYKKDDLDFTHTHTINLDEYVGLSRNEPQSYYSFMHQVFFDHINISPANISLPDGLAVNTDEECKRYENHIKELGGVDLQVLGIGHNGHIGFNEPSDCFQRDTHVVKLSDSTIEANKRYFDNADLVPKSAITMGIRTIMQARSIIVLCSGENKAEILKDALFDKITPENQASILQIHSNVTVIADDAALSKVSEQMQFGELII